mmetsp:Transcript_21378/g.25749  ORF Transcript_21378/g.25749 Transcript_21378/m.25749 type:complete len:739 (+) Transcript_21378:226-2442(+)|eukprot:CAMPEP_0197865182 /NCGR_PEP_ID=MMETSP1438-20131217/43515_1 /TAXON_ID=1461541 /ORGANISM="Pterosperma sp., Strain CCMP1384" /LENGTH=738 /DNA_ID=CAMNT_0043483605 /DNA_START=223 /DNA_END=2439 /DNA_ORIENTATION=+
MVETMWPFQGARVAFARVARRKQEIPEIMKLDRQALKEPDIAEKFKEACEEGCDKIMEGIGDAGMSSSKIWEDLREVMTKAAIDTLPKRDRRPTARFLSDETKLLCYERARLMEREKSVEERKRVNFLTREIRRRVGEEREKYMLGLCEQVNAGRAARNAAQVYDAVKKIAGKGRVNVSHVEADVWIKHFHDLFATLQRPVDDDFVEKLRDVVPKKVYEQMQQIDTSTPTVSEIEEALKKMKNDRAVGLDGLSKEMFQYGGENCILVLREIFELILQGDDWPDDWVVSVLVPIFKRHGVSYNPNNYRGVSVIAAASKILAYIISNRMLIVNDAFIGEYQNGFRKKRGTEDATLTFHVLAELLREQGVPLYTAFIDYKKAFDSVSWKVLFRMLRVLGIPETLVSVIERMYDKSYFKVSTEDGLSDGINQCVGVRQGCMLSPLLFNIFMEFLVRCLSSLEEDAGVRLQNMLLELIAYADDLALNHMSMGELADRLGELDKVSLQAGFDISLDKTEWMVANYDAESRKLKLRGSDLKRCTEFTYLGVIQSSDVGSRPAIVARMEKATKAFRSLRSVWKQKMTWKTKGTLYKTLVRSILMAGAGTWTTTTGDYRLLEVWEANLVRELLRVSRLQHIETKELRNRLGIDTSVQEEVCRSRLRLFGHVMRLGDERAIKTVVNQAMTGVKSGRKGRPRTSWIGCVKHDLKKRGYGLYSAAGIAKCREKYRREVVFGAAKEGRNQR